MKKFFPLLLLALSCQTPPSHPNVILIMTDDLGWGDVGFNGSPNIRTPHLDRLAAKGIVFDRFYSASAVCSPTRASVLTGRNPFRMGIHTANDGHMLDYEITLAEMLRDAGYATGHFGKWHLGTLTTEIHDANRGRPGDSSHFSIPTQHGFDVYFSTESKVPTYDPMIKPPAFDTLNGEGLRYGWAAVEGGASESYGTHYWTHPGPPETENLEGDNSRVIMDRVLPFIEIAYASGRPFFSVIWFHTPHLPVVADEAMRAEYADLPHDRQIYNSTISAMDAQVGRLWDRLEALGIADNTMLWFTSDNGPERQTPGSSGPFRERKRSLYEGGVRVPSFAVWPGHFDANQRLSTPMVTSDYLPTIAGYLGLDTPTDRAIDGIDLSPILTGSQSERGRPIGFQVHDKISWVDDTYKLISTDAGQSFELYNLVDDREERHEISAAHPERVEDMKAALLSWVADTKADCRERQNVECR